MYPELFPYIRADQFQFISKEEGESARMTRKRRPMKGDTGSPCLKQVLQPAEECRHESAFIVLHRAAVGYQQLSLHHHM